MNSFKEWLENKGINKENSIKGDFANDILHDPNFPESKDENEVYMYMKKNTENQPSGHSLPIFAKMFKNYLDETNNK